jgi:peptide-methionine (R)-S-oxide reductase
VFESIEARPTRRDVLSFCAASLGGAGALWWWRNINFSDPLPGSDFGDEVPIVEFSDGGSRLGIANVRRVIRSDADWWNRMTPQQFYVTRRHRTDTPFTGTHYRKQESGFYRCIGCENALFSSETKYDSGTGWPSFREPIAVENLRADSPPGLSRDAALASGIEVLCKRCDAHLGHVFGDGPPPTGLRYCINESALRFVRAA